VPPLESFYRVHWVAVPKALRARRVNSLNTSWRLLRCDLLEGNQFLLCCFGGTLVATWAATLHLSWHTLRRIRDSRMQTPLLTPLPRPSADAADWRNTDLSLGGSSATSQSSTTRLVLSRTWLVPLVVMCSMSRFQSLAILRLRLCGRTLLDYPMEDRYLFFLR
jgi:hypothetical protein